MGCRIGDLRKDVSSVTNETHISTHLQNKKNKCIYIGHARIDNPFKPTLKLHDGFEDLDFFLCMSILRVSSEMSG
jgi:hypothetical protein